MSEASRELEGLEFQKEQMEKQIAFAKRVTVLLSNPDFRAVILEEYCVKEAARFVAQGGDPVFTKEQREDALAMGMAAGHLKRWLLATQTQAEKMADTIPEIEENLAELRAVVDAERE